MKKNILIITLIIVVIGVAAYLIKLSQPRVAVATLNSQNNSGQAGTATLVNTPDGKVQVTITLFGVTAGVSQPAHIHEGTCEKLGAIKYPLANLLNGDSVTIIDTTVGKLGGSLPLAVNIHKSDREGKIYTACGDIIVP